MQVGVLQAHGADAELGEIAEAPGQLSVRSRGQLVNHVLSLLVALLVAQRYGSQRCQWGCSGEGAGGKASPPASTIAAPPSTVITAPLT